jgi:hypothetical protein
MREPEQDEPLDIGGNLGWCRHCQKRRALCEFAMCVACHVERRPGVGHEAQAGELCCGWWATGSFTEIWTCPTCGKVFHGYS